MTSTAAHSEVSFDWVAMTPELDDLESASLRRIVNLSELLPGDWSGMMSITGGRQEDFGALRFQLAYMSYALAITHAFRLPAAPALFKAPFEALVQKILHPDCWFYWRDLSRGGHPLNLSLGPMKSEWDPMVRDNIMYSAYVQSMALLYHYMFGDAKYEEVGALTVGYNSMLWDANESFSYDERSLNEHVYWLMVQNGYLGVACEPNCVFPVCQQPAIIGFRLHDFLNGGDSAGEVTRGWLKAWEEFGGVTTDGASYKALILEKERQPLELPMPTLDFWLTSLMHSWNPEAVERQYPRLMAQWSVDGPDGTLWVKPVNPFEAMGLEENPLNAPAQDMGWAAVAASEVGDTSSLTRLLAYADRYLNPAWENGGYFYKRCDEFYDSDGNLCHMDPMAGNALLLLARLNVPHGFRRLYDGAWNEGHFDEPLIVDLTPNVDIRRAWFDSERNALAITLGASSSAQSIRLEIEDKAGRGLPQLWRDGAEFGEAIRSEGDHRLVIAFEHQPRTDLVLTW